MTLIVNLTRYGLAFQFTWREPPAEDDYSMTFSNDVGATREVPLTRPTLGFTLPSTELEGE